MSVTNAGSWSETTFGEIVEPVSINGKKVPRSDYLENGRFPVVDQGRQFIGGYSDDESKVISEGLPLLVFGDHTRAFKYLDQPFVPGADGVKVLRPIGVDPKWLYQIAHALDFPDKGYARHYQHLKAAKLLLPSLAEQRLIAADLEKQFSRLDAGVAALKRVQANLKRYRAAVLKAACEGRLVPTEAELARKEGRTYETGADLLARILNERREGWQGSGPYKEPAAPDVRDLRNLPEGWTYASVEVVGSVQLGRQRAPKHHSGTNMRPYLRVANVYEDRLDLGDVKEMNFTPKEFETFRLEPNDILLNEGQSLELVGRPALYRGELPGACFTNTLLRFRPYPSLSVKFALSVFRAFMHAGRFQRIAKWTTNIAHLGADRFAKLAFPLPPLPEQRRIVAELEGRLSVIEELEATVNGNLKRAARLRQSILQTAFTGRL